MSSRWQCKAVEIPYRLFDNQTGRVRQEPDKHGRQGWDLVAVVSADSIRTFFAKHA